MRLTSDLAIYNLHLHHHQILLSVAYNSCTELIPISTDESFILRCADVGLDCNCVNFGSSEENTVDNTITHMFEYHAINPQEMTTCMKLKIKENVNTSPSSSDIYEFSPISSSTLLQ